MPLQLLCQLETAEPETARAALLDDAENQQNAGLTRLQIWTEEDAPDRLWVLFEANDRARAEAWLERARAHTHGRPAAVSASSAHFLRTT